MISIMFRFGALCNNLPRILNKDTPMMKTALFIGLLALSGYSSLPINNANAGSMQPSVHAGHDMSGDMAGHDMSSSSAAATQPSEVGQSAFAVIAEIVAMLEADANTDWERVDIEVLRQHLIDMSRVTLRAKVESTAITDGQLFTVSSKDAQVIASIQAMVLAHASIMDGKTGRTMVAEKTSTGATLQVTSADAKQSAVIKGLGFAGIMASGMHHQSHHWAMARGLSPHR